MKVVFKFGIGAFSGTIQEGVYSMSRNKTGSIMRKWVRPKLTANMTELGSITKNLAKIWSACSAGYKLNLKTYCSRWNSEYLDPNDPFSPRVTSYGIFTKLLYAFRASDPTHVDLESITYSDLQTVGTDILTVSDSIENGFLATISVYDDLTTPM